MRSTTSRFERETEQRVSRFRSRTSICAFRHKAEDPITTSARWELLISNCTCVGKLFIRVFTPLTHRKYQNTPFPSETMYFSETFMIRELVSSFIEKITCIDTNLPNSSFCIHLRLWKLLAKGFHSRKSRRIASKSRHFQIVQCPRPQSSFTEPRDVEWFTTAADDYKFLPTKYKRKYQAVCLSFLRSIAFLLKNRLLWLMWEGLIHRTPQCHEDFAPHRLVLKAESTACEAPNLRGAGTPLRTKSDVWWNF